MKQPDRTASAHPDAIAEARANPLGTLLVIAEEFERSGASKAGLIVREVLSTLRAEQPKPPREAIATLGEYPMFDINSPAYRREASVAFAEIEAFVKAVSK